MKWDELSQQQCSVARSLAVIGDRWTILILSDCFLGVKRFDLFRERLQISKTILSDRLNLLEREGVLRKKAYQQAPARYEYKLTAKGLDLYPVIITLVNWGDRHYADEAGAPIVHRHKSCQHDFEPQLVCSHCHEPVSASETEARKRPDSPQFPAVTRGPVLVAS